MVNPKLVPLTRAILAQKVLTIVEMRNALRVVGVNNISALNEEQSNEFVFALVEEIVAKTRRPEVASDPYADFANRVTTAKPSLAERTVGKAPELGMGYCGGPAPIDADGNYAPPAFDKDD